MGGGWGRQGSGIPLAQRMQAGAAASSAPPLDGPQEPCPVRHCWVADPVDGAEERPGMLCEWRRGPHGWEGRVVYPARLRAEGWTLVEEWVPAAALSPAGP